MSSCLLCVQHVHPAATESSPVCLEPQRTLLLAPSSPQTSCGATLRRWRVRRGSSRPGKDAPQPAGRTAPSRACCQTWRPRQRCLQVTMADQGLDCLPMRCRFLTQAQPGTAPQTVSMPKFSTLTLPSPARPRRPQRLVGRVNRRPGLRPPPGRLHAPAAAAVGRLPPRGGAAAGAELPARPDQRE